MDKTINELTILVENTLNGLDSISKMIKILGEQVSPISENYRILATQIQTLTVTMAVTEKLIIQIKEDQDRHCELLYRGHGDQKSLVSDLGLIKDHLGNFEQRLFSLEINQRNDLIGVKQETKLNLRERVNFRNAMILTVFAGNLGLIISFLQQIVNYLRSIIH